MIKARSEGARKEDKAEPPPKKEQSKADKSDEEPAMRSDAGVRPKDVDDHKATLEDKLKAGFMVAYRHRVATATGERAEAN